MPDGTKRLDATQAMGWFVQTLRSIGVIEAGEDAQEAMLHGLTPESKSELVQAAEADQAFAAGFQALVGEPVDAFLEGARTVANLAKKLIDAGNSNKATGADRFADKAPTTALASLATADEGEEGLDVTVRGAEVEAGEGVVLMPGQMLFEGALPDAKVQKAWQKTWKGSEKAKTARENLVAVIETMKTLKGKGAVNPELLANALRLFDALVGGTIIPPVESMVLGSEVAARVINVISRHEVEAKIWLEDVINANFERGYAGKDFVVPEAKPHSDLYEEEHIPEAGTSMQTSVTGAFRQTADTYFQLEEFLKQYPDVARLLAEKKPGLFGPEALERLRVRNEALRELYATDDWAEREALLLQFTNDGVFPPADEAAAKEGEELQTMQAEVAEILDLLMRRNDRAARQEIDPNYTGKKWRWDWRSRSAVTINEPPPEEIDWSDIELQEFMEAAGGRKLADGRTVAEAVDAIEPNQRRLDLYSAALARDLALMITVVRVAGKLPPEQVEAALAKVPELAEMEEMWRPTEAGMKEGDRVSLLKAAGLLPDRDTPMLALPPSVEKRYITGNALLLTAAAVEKAVDGAEGAVIISRVEGEGSTALTVVAKRGTPGDTKAQVGAAVQDLVRSVKEGNPERMAETVRGLERILNKGEGTLMAELAGGTSPLCKVIGRKFGEEARGRLAEMAAKKAGKAPRGEGFKGLGKERAK